MLIIKRRVVTIPIEHNLVNNLVGVLSNKSLKKIVKNNPKILLQMIKSKIFVRRIFLSKRV